MKRGDVVVVALPGDFGKPRPAVVVQSDALNDAWPTLAVAPLTTTIADAPLLRVTVDPSPMNGLRSVSQIMIDKTMPVRRRRVGATVGRLEDDILRRVDRALAVWLGLA